MEAWQNRVVDEYADLSGLIAKLEAFLVREGKETDADEIERLKTQLRAMLDYRTALRSRIEVW